MKKIPDSMCAWNAQIEKRERERKKRRGREWEEKIKFDVCRSRGASQRKEQKLNKLVCMCLNVTKKKESVRKRERGRERKNRESHIFTVLLHVQSYEPPLIWFWKCIVEVSNTLPELFQPETSHYFLFSFIYSSNPGFLGLCAAFTRTVCTVFTCVPNSCVGFFPPPLIFLPLFATVHNSP